MNYFDIRKLQSALNNLKIVFLHSNVDLSNQEITSLLKTIPTLELGKGNINESLELDLDLQARRIAKVENNVWQIVAEFEKFLTFVDPSVNVEFPTQTVLMALSEFETFARQKVDVDTPGIKDITNLPEILAFASETIQVKQAKVLTKDEIHSIVSNAARSKLMEVEVKDRLNISAFAELLQNTSIEAVANFDFKATSLMQATTIIGILSQLGITTGMTAKFDEITTKAIINTFELNDLLGMVAMENNISKPIAPNIEAVAKIVSSLEANERDGTQVVIPKAFEELNTIYVYTEKLTTVTILALLKSIFNISIEVCPAPAKSNGGSETNFDMDFKTAFSMPSAKHIIQTTNITPNVRMTVGSERANILKDFKSNTLFDIKTKTIRNLKITEI